MASIQARISRGKKYWSIVECRRINGKPRTVILQYLGTAQTLLEKLQQGYGFSLKSYSHGDTHALLQAAIELEIIPIINQYVPAGKKRGKPIRDGLSVGASFLFAAIGRACRPTSKMGWYDWCRQTSLEYSLRSSFKSLDSQHFWDQMHALPQKAIVRIEEALVQKLIQTYEIKLDCLFFDCTNFFTFIASTNNRCNLPQRGRNKQKRFDLRQIGLALLVSRADQFPLFHQTYRGNQNDVSVFQETFQTLLKRLKSLSQELSEITVVFDKGNNSKANFKRLDQEKQFFYVGSLVPSYFKDLIQRANPHFEDLAVDGEKVPVYRTRQDVWGCERTCVVIISAQLKEGQIRGIEQHLKKKNKELETFKKQLENPKRRKTLTQPEIQERLSNIIRGQFIQDVLKTQAIQLEEGSWSFTYGVDPKAFEHLKENVLGRRILITNRHEWTTQEIILAYRGQAKVEYAFRNLKNPYHLAIRPQYHWTDQKIEAHIFMCFIGYLLSIAVYTRAKRQAQYPKNISNLMEDLRTIRLALVRKKKGNQLQVQLEKIPKRLQKVAEVLGISNQTIRPKLNFSDYTE